MKTRAPYLTKLGKAIRLARTLKGLSQESLSSLSGLHRTYIGGIERGERNVSIENLLRIARALEVQCASLILELHHSDLDDYDES